MADIVNSLFGLPPEDVRQQLYKEQQDFASQLANTYANPIDRRNALLGGMVGNALANVGAGIFGVQDPRLKRATDLENILQQTQQELGQSANDPTVLYPALQQKLANAGFSREAMQVGQVGQKAIQEAQLNQAKLATEQAQQYKAQQEAAVKQNELDTIRNYQSELSTLDPASPTYNSQVKQLTLKYASPDKLFATIQRSEDLADYREMALAQVDKAIEGRIKVATINGATKLEKEKIEQEGAAQRDAIKANSASTNPKINANEKLIANTMTTALAEAGIATDNLANLTNKGTVYTSAGAFNNLSDEGIFGATAKVIARGTTPQDKAMYEAVMLPLVRQVVTIQSGGRYKITEGAVKQEIQAIMTQAGQSHETMLAKMGELKQTIVKSAEAALASGALNPEQRKLVEENIAKIDKAIPWEVNDVINFVNSGGKGKNFKSWLDSTKVSFTPTKQLTPDQEQKMTKTIQAISSGKITKEAGKTLLKKYGIEVK